MKIKKYLLLVAFASVFTFTKAQTNHEVGIFMGPTFMQTDYGEGGEFSSTAKNLGFGFTFAYVADFSEGNAGFFAQHLKLRVEASYMKANLEYDGAAIEGGWEPEQKDLYRSMKGDTKTFSFGISPEIHLFKIEDFKLFQPYLVGGISYVSANPSLKSTTDLPTIYTDGGEDQNVFMYHQSLYSYNAGAGARLQFDNIAIVLEGRFVRFSNDRVEGLDSDIEGDKHEDSLVKINLGVLFNIN